MAEPGITKVLFADDDRDARHMFGFALRRAGYQVISAADGLEAVRRYVEYQPDLVILDLMMPGMNGWQACTQIRRMSKVPIIALSALHEEETMIRTLDGGAVDFITKPVSMALLLARVRAVLRQSAAGLAQTSSRYEDDYLAIDLQKQHVFVKGKLVDLTATEHKLLVCLYQHAGQVVPSDQILRTIWGLDFTDSRNTVHVYMSRLRRKLEQDPSTPRYLRTKKGIGYWFQAQNTSPIL